MTRTPESHPADDATLRADAERNRQRVLAAACEVFAESGIEVKVEEIARRAGVGVGTLYRRYPTRADLVAAAFEAKMREFTDSTRAALADPDPWRGFCSLVEQVCAMQAEDRGFAEVLTRTFPAAKQLEAERDRAYADFSALVERAKAAGKLRPDFAAQDLPLFLMANAGVLALTADVAPEAWRRVVGYLLQACAADRAQPLPDPPAPSDVYQAMVRLSRERRGRPRK